MIDSMHILDTLRKRHYMPQDDARPGEGWFDKVAPEGWRVRAVITDSDVRIFVFDDAMMNEWGARFSDGTPSAVITAALRMAEAAVIDLAEPCLMCGEPSVPEGEGPLCDRCEAGQDAESCPDAACREQGCPEHPACNQGDHTYEQHHSPRDHAGDGPCRCNVYANA